MRQIIALFTVALLMYGAACASYVMHMETNTEMQKHKENGNLWRVGYSEGTKLPYLITFPAGFETGARESPPLIVFLHSLEERGTTVNVLFDNPRGQGEGIAAHALRSNGFPFITLSPLCPRGTGWPVMKKRLRTLILEILDLYKADPARVYLTGVSMGGMGTWALAMKYPELFAAIAPISGAVYFPIMRNNVRAIKDLPVWAFHDQNDPSIPIRKERRTINKLKSIGGNLHYTITHEGIHYIHSTIYSEGALFNWFLQHTNQSIIPQK